MHHQRKARPTHIHMLTLTWPCDEHGHHRVIVAGLDDTADLVAKIVQRNPTETGEPPLVSLELIPLDDARRAYHGLDFDDLPY